MFEDTFNEVTIATYIIGDFAMHYFPSLVALALVNPSKLSTEPSQVVAQIWLGFALFLTWDYFHSKLLL